MMKVVQYAGIVLLVLSNAASAGNLAPEQKEVVAFVQKMYSYGAGAFEFGQFNGHYDSEKYCALMEDFFQKQLLSPLKKEQGCDPGNVFVRYPGVGNEELGYNLKPGQMPKPKFSTPKVEGDKATISASTKDFGKVQFFLTKTDKGWRIENALYDEWPPINDGKCRSDFLRPPTAWQRKETPAICQ